MKLWISSDSTLGAWYDVSAIDPDHHGRGESGEILRYYADNKTDLIAAYYWDQAKSKYRKQNL